jgi:hypothetical protein
MKFTSLLLFLILFTGCSSSKIDITDMLQTQNAKHIKNHYRSITSLLLEYKTKIDKRNPQNYDRSLDNLLRKNIKRSNNITLHSKSHKRFTNYRQYLDYAFSKQTNIINRNDYLIVGIYKMFFYAYEMKKTHKITALDYDVERFQKIYKNMQVINWRIKHNKDINGDYLFLTWQNNWQIELQEILKNKENYKINIDDIRYLKTKRESLLDPSNSSFEILVLTMLTHLRESIELLGAEPEELALESILTFTFLL